MRADAVGNVLVEPVEDQPLLLLDDLSDIALNTHDRFLLRAGRV